MHVYLNLSINYHDEVLLNDSWKSYCMTHKPHSGVNQTCVSFAQEDVVLYNVRKFTQMFAVWFDQCMGIAHA